MKRLERRGKDSNVQCISAKVLAAIALAVFIAAIATTANACVLNTECDDGNPCTIDSCNPSDIFHRDTIGCVHTTIADCNIIGVITTLAGVGNHSSFPDNGTAALAVLSSPKSVAVDSSGNIYIAENNDRIRKMNTDGLITTMTGSAYGVAVAVDSSGNIYAADYYDEIIRKVDTNGIVTTVAGIYGTYGYTGDGGPATSALLSLPDGVAVDSSGNIYINDLGNVRIRKVDAGGTITTFAGNGTTEYSGDGGPAILAGLDPAGVAVDSLGNVYIADVDNHRIRKVDAGGTITTIAGNGTAGYSGDGDPATSASLKFPSGVAVDLFGNIYIADTGNNCIRKVDSGGTITTVAGNGTAGYSGDYGPAISAKIQSPHGIVVDSARHNLYIADTGNNRIRKVKLLIQTCSGQQDGTPCEDGDLCTIGDVCASGSCQPGSPKDCSDGKTCTNDFCTEGVCSNPVICTGGQVCDESGNCASPPEPITFAGTGTWGYSGDNGQATSARFESPSGVAVDLSGNIYIADADTNCIRKVDVNGIITTVAGNGTAGYSGDNGPATSAKVSDPQGVAVDSSGNIYIVDTGNNRIRKVDTNGIITTVVGTGTGGSSGDNGPATSAKLFSPSGVAVDTSGNIYIADSGNYRIRKVDKSGIITTVAGDGTPGYSGDGGPATLAGLDSSGVAVDSSGNIYIADAYNNCIRKVDAEGTITTVAGNPYALYYGDNGPAIFVYLDNPHGVAVDSTGNIYIAETGYNRIRKVDTNGIITTVVGGLATSAQLDNPEGVAVDSSGNIYIADTYNSRILFVLMGIRPPTVLAPILWYNTGSGQVYALITDGGTITSGAGIWWEPNTTWSIVGKGDFDGDGVRDYVWRNSSTGVVFLMFMTDAVTVKGWAFVWTEPDQNWKIVATGDLNGDGKTDLIWWNSSTGQVYGMLMNGSSPPTAASIWIEPDVANWRIVAAGDLNGDHKADLIWWNRSTGQVYGMLMDGLSVASTGGIWIEPNTNWRLVGAGDIDGDGKADLIWRSRETGQVFGMKMDGLNVTNTGGIWVEPSLDWEIVSIDNYTADTKADLLWRNKIAGSVFLMPMNGLSASSGSMLWTEPSSAWRILGDTEWKNNVYGAGVTTP